MLPPGAGGRRTRPSPPAGHAARAWARGRSTEHGRTSPADPRQPYSNNRATTEHAQRQHITSPGSARGRTRSRSDGPANAASRSVGSARPRSVMKFGATRYMLHCSCIQLIYIGYVLQFSASALPPCAREQTDRRVDGQARGERPRHPKHLLLCKLARRRTAQLPELARVLLA
jgi:hypothetical protein